MYAKSFNSTLVQLKVNPCLVFAPILRCFNSTLVQLKVFPPAFPYPFFLVSILP